MAVETALLALFLETGLKSDVAFCASGTCQADVRFVWEGFAQNSIQITGSLAHLLDIRVRVSLKPSVLGEFNGWKGEELLPHEVGVSYIVKRLPAGRYRYRFLVDGETWLHPTASKVMDGGVTSNMITVMNVPASAAALGLKINDTCEANPTAATCEELTLRNHRLGDDALWALGTALRMSAGTIHTLDLSHNHLADNGLLSLCAAVTRLPLLRTLRLGGNAFGYPSLKVFLQRISGHDKLRQLELSGNCVCEEGALVVGAYLADNPALERLFLNACSLSNKGASAIGSGLERNNRLIELSIAYNDISATGSCNLSLSLRKNATLRSLNIAGNPLGPIGSQWLGEMLLINATLVRLDVSHCLVMHKRVSSGLNSLLCALQKSAAMTHMILKNNCIDDSAIVWIAHSLSLNRSLIVLDLDDNCIQSIWFRPDTYVTNRDCTNMPSVRTSLDRNRANVQLYLDNNAKKVQESNRRKELKVKGRLPTEEVMVHRNSDNANGLGVWTDKQKWRSANGHLDAHSREEEDERLLCEAEDRHVAGCVSEYQCYVDEYLRSASGLTHVRVLGAEVGKVVRGFGQSGGSVHGLAVLSSVFVLAGGTAYTLPVSGVLGMLKLIGLAISAESLASAVDMMCVDKTRMVGVRSVLRYVQDNAASMRDTRARLVSYVFPYSYHRRVAEAILMEQLLDERKLEATREYREQEGKLPRFLCPECRARFSTEATHFRHLTKPHRTSEQLVRKSRQSLLSLVQLAMTGRTLPHYFELAEGLPYSISPQMLNGFGPAGRPLGVLELGTLYLCTGLVGEYLRIEYGGSEGWVKRTYKSLIVLIPAYQHIAGFWSALTLLDNEQFYRVNPELAGSVEVKVRVRPEMSGEVCGYLTRGAMVACASVLGDWVAVRFDKRDVAWALRVSGGRELLLPLPEHIQTVLRGKRPASPCFPPDSFFESVQASATGAPVDRGASR